VILKNAPADLYFWVKRNVARSTVWYARRLAGDSGEGGLPLPRHHFVTIDVESNVIVDGIRAICDIRDEVERAESMRLPLIWFVRFQRTWREYVEYDSRAYFAGPFRDGFDGFELAKEQLHELRSRGDEVGWHYHPYSYIHRTDLSHERRLGILEVDLRTCAAEIVLRHPEFELASFRFGWFFVPDYGLFRTLADLGIRLDASVHPGKAGMRVAGGPARYLPPLARQPKLMKGLYIFPFVRTHLIHDWNVVPHDLGWSRLGPEQAKRERQTLRAELTAIAAELRASGGAFMTYKEALDRSASQEPLNNSTLDQNNSTRD
jgi:hypothetical protein